MNNNPADVLKNFHSIDKRVIRYDLERIKANTKAIGDEIDALRAVDFKLRTSKIEAMILHLNMVRAYGFCRLPHIEPEIKIFYATIIAQKITMNVMMAAHNKGHLADISKRMVEIGKREGLADDEFWYCGAGPDDYNACDGEYNKIFEKIEATYFVDSLKRYEMDWVAELFENDPYEFEIQREIGRRVCMSHEKDILNNNNLIDKDLRARYGSDVLASTVSILKVRI